MTGISESRYCNFMMMARGTCRKLRPCRLAAACLFFTHAFALDPSRAVTQYGHTAWRIQDGYFLSSPRAIAQTKDGQLWIGGEGGLLRFDGVQFSPWRAPDGQALPDERVFSLLGASDGSLWIGTGWGLARWKDGQLVTYAKLGRFLAIAEDSRGTIWAEHMRSTYVLPPLCRFAGNDFKCFAASDRPLPGIPAANGLAVDRNGDLWVGINSGVCRWHEARAECYMIPGSSSAKEPLGVEVLGIDSDNVVWLNAGVSGIWQLTSGRWKRYVESPQLKLQLAAALPDGKGGLWLGDVNHGIFRHSRGRVENFTRADGLSGDTITTIFQDREGSVWVGTSSGLDRFRDVKVATLTQREGLPVTVVGSIASSRDGSLWIGGQFKLVRLRVGEVAAYEEVRGLPQKAELNSTVFEDSRGRLWLGVGDVVKWLEDGQFHQVPALKMFPTNQSVRAIAEDIDGTILIATTDPQLALIRIGDGRVLERFTMQQVGQQINAMVGNPAGGVWLCRSVIPGLILARSGKLEAFAKEFPSSARNAFVDSDGLWEFTPTGAGLFRDGAVNILGTKNGLPCNPRMGGLKDNSGALWLKGACGLMRISSPELELWMKNPTRQVQFRYFDASDGVQAGNAVFSSVARTSDGRLWFALDQGGIQVVDPKLLEDNSIPPPVAVTGLVVNHSAYPLTPEARLPAHTRDLEIDYTAYSFIVPERMRFRYRLGGNDATWQEVGNRRQAYFSNLKPGRYRFEVWGSNNDGVWNEQGATLNFSIAPAYYQTATFRVLCIALASGTLYMLYLFRVRQATQRVQAGMEARLGERERIARDLHDTLLQSVQGLILKFHAIAKRIPTTEPARQEIEKVLDYADQVLVEGRDRVRDLRTSTIEVGGLPKAFQRVVEEVAPHRATSFKTVVEGTVLELHPIIREESYAIGREALINALTHSESRNIEVEIIYDQHEFRLRVRDDGRGIDLAILEKGGRTDHWGLQGMRERAGRIGAQLDVWSRPGSGTEIELRIPAATAYRSVRSKTTDSRSRLSAAG
jgi:signal transduction histidine kinase/ligand-binding sensor domain-containing protein